MRAAKGSPDPIDLLVEEMEALKHYRLDCHEGDRYPSLQRDASRPDLLDLMLMPLRPAE